MRARREAGGTIGRVETKEPRRDVAARAQQRARDLWDPLRDREVRLLWMAKISSEVGDWAARLALAYLVLDQTGSATFVAAVTTISLAPWLGLGQVLSTLADRYPHRWVMLVSDMVRVVVFLLIAWVSMPLWVLFGLVFLAGAAAPPFEAARSACLPELVSKERYGRTLLLFNATYQTGLLLGYAGGGGLLALVGPSWALSVNATTFALSGVLVLLMRSRTRAVHDDETQAAHMSTRVRLGGALKGYGKDKLLRRAVLLLVLANIPIVAVEGIIVLYADAYAGSGPQVAGLLSALVAIGALVGMFVVPHSGRHTKLVRTSSILILLGVGVSSTLLVLAPDLLWGTLPLLLLGAISALSVPLGAVLGQRLPRATRATSFSLAQGALMGAAAGGALLAGVLAEHVGLNWAIVLVGVPGLLLALVTLWAPHQGDQAEVPPAGKVAQEKRA